MTQTMTQLDPILEFREDNRKVRDVLLKIMEALKAKDVVKARGILDNLNNLLGIHFRYEEEALYRTLRTFLGEAVDQLLKEHDGVIETARNCAELLKKDTLSDAEEEQAVKASRTLLIYVSNCDSLSILSERLKPEELDELGEKYATARNAAIPLLDWAENIRNK